MVAANAPLKVPPQHRSSCCSIQEKCSGAAAAPPPPHRNPVRTPSRAGLVQVMFLVLVSVRRQLTGFKTAFKLALIRL